jgi:hypothetical protein
MNLKPHAAFGYVLIENTYADGETWNAIINSDIKCTTFWVQGLFKNKHLSLSTEDIEDFQPGHFLRPADYVPGVFEHTSVGESKVFCFDQRLNNNTYVEIVPFVLKSGNQETLPNNAKLFLCAGSLSVGEKTISKPSQISVQSGDVLVSALTDCYGLVF